MKPEIRNGGLTTAYTRDGLLICVVACATLSVGYFSLYVGVDRTFFRSYTVDKYKNLKWQQCFTPRRSLRGPARWVAEGPRRRRGVHRDGLEEAVNPSSGRLTFFDFVRPQSRSEQLRVSVSRSHRHSLQSTSVRATQIPTP